MLAFNQFLVLSLVISFGRAYAEKLPLVNAIIGGHISLPRRFYAHVNVIGMDGFCGATIIDTIWVLTAATCVYGRLPYEVLIRVGSYSTVASPKRIYFVSSIFIPDGFEPGPRPKNNLALLGLSLWISEQFVQPIRLCRFSTADFCESNSLRFCGLGSRSPYHLEFPGLLRETWFTETKFDLYNWEWCRDDLICVELTRESNICHFDEGGPLYKLHPGPNSVNCLYGVASYHMSDERPCKDGSYFTSIPYFYSWIQEKMRENKR